MKSEAKLRELLAVANQNSNKCLAALQKEQAKIPQNMGRINDIQKGMLVFQMAANTLKWALSENDENENLKYWFAP